MAAQADALEQALFHDLGVRLPPVRLVPRADVPAESFIVRINSSPGIPWRGLRPGQWFVNATGEYLETLDIAFSPGRHPSSGVNCGVVTEESLPRMQQLGVQHWDALSHLFVAVGGEARRKAGWLIDADSAAHEMALIGSTHADIVDAALAYVTVGRLTAILRILLVGGVPIRDLRGILERVIAFDYAVGDDEGRLLLGDALVLERNTTGEPIERAETFARYIRKTLARVITGRAAPDGEVLPVFLMGWEAEQPLLSHLAHLAGTPGGTPITSAEIESLHDAIRQTIEEVTDVTRLPPIVTNASVAELLRESIAPAFPHMTVLSFEDLTPGVSLSTLKRITPP
jgi:type III secretory pathway component EscV